jgi:hypothetical protein
MLEPTSTMDVYSFGMILWELWHEMIPFDNDLKFATRYVLVEDSRPMIMSSDCKTPCSTEMANLIRVCWQKDPSNRPTFLNIC